MTKFRAGDKVKINTRSLLDTFGGYEGFVKGYTRSGHVIVIVSNPITLYRWDSNLDLIEEGL